MQISLTETNASKIAHALVKARRAAGSPAMDMVLTFIVVTDDDTVGLDLLTALDLSREHPSRVIGVVLGDGRGGPRLDAKVRVGETSAGESLLLRISGALTKHAESVVLPLLLPDSPVVVWWPADPPTDPAAHPLGRLAQRRITDAAATTRQRTRALVQQAASYTRGNTDLAWTRLTSWRALLAAALDQHPMKVRFVSVAGEQSSPSADLLAAWLADRLGVAAERTPSNGPGITEVRLHGRRGDIVLARPDGKVATLSVPNSPDRPVALARRPLSDLLAEELRHLDEDEPYAEAARRLLLLSREGRTDD